ncbi:MAG: hypothetical protein K6F47_05625 [Bacteroidaceae bacterium]|nr:hypothetical protein [Bacteroidaceae bacterium]
MTKDKALEDIFLAQTPKFDDKAQFMAKLTKRLDAVEYIRQYQEATLRRYKMAMVVTFVVGIISGAVTIGFLLSTPVDVPLFTFQVQTGFLLWLMQNSLIIVSTALALLITLGIISIYNNIQDIRSFRQSPAFLS